MNKLFSLFLMDFKIKLIELPKKQHLNQEQPLGWAKFFAVKARVFHYYWLTLSNNVKFIAV